MCMITRAAPFFESEAGTGMGKWAPRLVSFERKLPDQAHAVTQSVEQSVAPTTGHKRSRFLIYGFVRFGEKAQALPWRRRGKFFHGDEKYGLSAGLPLHHGEMMQLSKLL
jgi:hypothetical protein